MTPHPSPIVHQADALGRALSDLASTAVDASLAQLEAAVLERVRAALPCLLGAMVETTQRSLRPGRQPRAPGCPQCGHATVAQRWQARSLLTQCGTLGFQRPWYRCRSCRQGFSPTDTTLGIAPRERLSAGLQDWLTKGGTATSFRGAAQLVKDFTGIAVPPETVRRVTEAAGSALAVAAATTAAALQQPGAAPPKVDPAPGQLAVEADGVMVRYWDGWHEVKIGVVGGSVHGRLQRKSYVAARATPETFGPLLVAEAARRGAWEVVDWHGVPWQRRLAVLRPVVVVGDGAHWIWNLAADHFGERTEIVDWYHATEHLWHAARSLFGEADAASWMEARKTELWTVGAAPVAAALATAHPPNPAAAEVVRQELGYFRNHAARMAYPAFRTQGYLVGSGAVESSARHVVQQRLKRAACRWRETGAAALLFLCCQAATSTDCAA